MKSWMVADALLLKAKAQRKLILCTREYQNSIKDSVMSVLEGQAERLEFYDDFTWQRDYVECKATGSTFIFKGLHHNIQSIKSTEGVDICWVEEAQTTTEESWRILIPTIRKAGSQIITTFNTDKDDDPTYKRMVIYANERDYVCKVTYLDNPWCPQEIIDDAKYMQRIDPDAYANVYLGDTWAKDDSQVLKSKFTIYDFDKPDNADGPYFGVDWGFSVDPCVIIRCWIKDNKLWIDQEAYGVGVEITDTGKLFDKVEGSRLHMIRADNARPELISHMAKEKFKIIAADKWAGSVEDGITFLRSFEQIVIHPRCIHTAQEARLWSYKKDKLTGDVLPVLIDKHNHCWDAIRYAIQPLIRKKPKGFFDV